MVDLVDSHAEHLLPEIRNLMQLSAAERIMYIEKDNWIGYPQAKAALKKLNHLYSHPKRQRMPNLLIIGQTNNGKSMIIEKFCRGYPPKLEKIYRPKEKYVLKDLPILSMQMESVPDTRRFYKDIFSKLGSAGGGENGILYAAPVESDVVYMLNHFNVRMLIIDEIHNILAGRRDKQHEFLNSLRYLGNALKIPIVCIGTKDAYLAIRSDAQLENRFEPFLLPIWKAGQDYESLLASIASVMPLKNISNLNHPIISKYILEKSEGILGEIFTLVRTAAIMAIDSGVEMINEAILKKIDYHSPTERIRIFERNITFAGTS